MWQIIRRRYQQAKAFGDEIHDLFFTEDGDPTVLWGPVAGLAFGLFMIWVISLGRPM